MKYIFEVSSEGAVQRVTQEDHGQVLRDTVRVVRMEDACRQLKRSRRHLYRYVARGWLKPVAKFSGELFFDQSDLAALGPHASQGRRNALPRRLAPLFPEYDIKALAPERDAEMILSRVLERGNEREIRWAIRRFPLRRRRLFLSRQGRRLLSARAFHFWSWLWGRVRPSKTPAWRESGLAWGGVA